MVISESLRRAVKTADTRQYRLAHKIGVHPSVLSGWLNGITAPKAGDERVLTLARLVGVPEEDCFESAAAKAGTR